MYPLKKHVHASSKTSISHYCHIIDQCFSIRRVSFAKTIHAQLIKIGLNSNNFLGNRCLELYTQFGPIGDALTLFNDMSEKNTVSWNICLRGLFRFGRSETAFKLFDEMPVKDVISWNSMISGLSSVGLYENAAEVFLEMQKAGFKPTRYTFSIMMSLVRSTYQAKQVHGNMIRICMGFSNLVLGNSLINMYGKIGLVDYAFGIFFTMENVDVITWNSLILGCHRAGFGGLALDHFRLMRMTEQSPDHFTMSIIISVCCGLHYLEKGKQIFAFCIKVGFLSNSIVSSAIIDLFSKCNRLEDAVRLFEELDRFDQALCNSMISCYAQHGFGHDAMCLFIRALREYLGLTEVTLSSVLSSVSGFMLMELGSQIHCLVVKLGFESDTVVASSILDMYAKVGLVDNAMEIFVNMDVRDLISWNTMILGLANNGKELEALHIFTKLVREGVFVDRITLSAVLLACNYGGFVDEGMIIYSLMEKEYGIIPDDEHYASIVDLLSRAGKLREAMDIIEAMPYKPSSTIWGSFLHACAIHGDLKLTERVAERVMELDPHSTLPYMVLIRAYEMRGGWESMVRVRKAMKTVVVKMLKDCSSVGIRNVVYTFNADQLQHHGGKEIYSVLNLLVWEIEDEDDAFEKLYYRG